MRYVIMGDVHLADRPPAMRTQSYAEDVLAKLDYVMTRAREVHAERVIVTGDLWHRRVPRDTSHRLVQQVRDVLTVRGMPVSLVPGNHDQGADGGTFGQPFDSVLGGEITRLDGPCPDDPYIFGVLWLASFAEDSPRILEALQRYFEAVGYGGQPLVFMHAPIVLEPNPFGPEQRGWVTAEDVVQVLPSTVRLVMASHMHGGHPVRSYPLRRYSEQVDEIVTYLNRYGLRFANPGALSRGSISDADRERVPQICIVEYDLNTGALDVRYEPIPCRPAAEVFRLAEHSATVHRSAALDALSQAFQVADETVVSRESLLAVLDALVRPDEIDATDWMAGIAMARATLEENN